MSKDAIERRVCPHCGHKYDRHLYYETKKDGLSICPKCRKRSDKIGRRVGKYSKPKLKECEYPGCDDGTGKELPFVFYTTGKQKYCPECVKKITRKYTKEWRRKNPEKYKESNKRSYRKRKAMKSEQ